MAFQARIGVGDTIVASTDVMGVPNVVLYLETADGDLGDVVAEWRGSDVDRAFETGELSRDSLHRTAYLQARTRGAFDRPEHDFAEAARRLEGGMLREMRGDLASRHRPWMETDDEEWIVDAAAAAARRLLHHEGGALAEAPRGMRHDAVEHLTGIGVAAEAVWRAGPAGEEVRIEGVPAHLRAARPEDVGAAAYAAMVARTREIGRMAAELEARAELLHEERDDVVRHLSNVLGASVPEAHDDDEFLPPPAP